MKFKKLLSLAVAGAMVFAMTIPAFAGLGDSSGGGGGGLGGGSNSSSAQTVEGGIAYASEIQTPTISIDVPSTGAVMLNPYRLTFTIDGDEKDDAFYSAPVVATNTSDCKVDVAASVKVTAGGDVKIVDGNETMPSENPGDKNVRLVLKVDIVDSDEIDDITTVSNKGVTLELDAADTDYTFGGEDDEDDPITLDPGNDDPNYLGFQLTGTINDNVSEVWASTDTVSVAIVLTFTPQPTQ